MIQLRKRWYRDVPPDALMVLVAILGVIATVFIAIIHLSLQTGL